MVKIVKTEVESGLTVSMASCEEQLVKAKALDDLAFGDHHGITIDELRTVAYGGGFVALMERWGQLVAESQVVMKQIGPLGWDLPEGAAFCYGIAVHPRFQGRGFGKLLLHEQEVIATDRGAVEMFTTVRVENRISIKMFMGVGHEIVGYVPFYGEELGDYRLLLGRSLGGSERQEYSESVVAPVTFGDEVDPAAHDFISRLLSEGFTGTSVTDGGICFRR